MYESSVFAQPNTARRIITNSRTLILQHPNIPHPVERWLWVLERKLNNDSLYWQTRANRYHMSEESLLRGIHLRAFSKAMKSPPTSFTPNISQQPLFAFNRGLPLVLFAPLLVPPFLASCGLQLLTTSAVFLWGMGGVKMELFSGWGGVDVVNPCFTPAAQYGRVTVQPVANLIYLRCSSFLHHSPPLTWTYTGRTVTVFL